MLLQIFFGISETIHNICNVYNIYRIPLDDERRHKWLNVISRDVSKTAMVCSNYFKQSDYYDNITSKLKRLKNSAIPSFFKQ